MKRLSLLLAFLCFAGVAEAQETLLPTGIAITLPIEQGLTAIVGTHNAKICLRVNAAGGEACTQAQACTAIGNPSGCASTPATARALNVRIYPNTNDAAGTAGRGEYVEFVWIRPGFQGSIGDPTSHEYERACINWNTFTDTQRNSACQALGRTLSTVAQPCRLCP
jgi:hypothetical protein